jgi:DNA polymerase III alpha subunit
MIAQLDKDGIEQIGLVKLDLLGNRNLSTVRYACELVRRRGGPEIDIETLDDADGPTVLLLRSADTVGCNQLESPAMRHLLAAMAPAGVADVMKALALIRPGAASIGMKEAFIRRQRGLDIPPPAPAAIARILGTTHGIMLYEDDVMLVAAAMTGLPMDQADRFRKSVQTCRDNAQRLALSREFLDACRANGFDPEYAKDMWIQMAKFNAYSFCRAHAGSYAALSYAGAWLKVRWNSGPRPSTTTRACTRCGCTSSRLSAAVCDSPCPTSTARTRSSASTTAPTATSSAWGWGGSPAWGPQPWRRSCGRERIGRSRAWATC